MTYSTNTNPRNVNLEIQDSIESRIAELEAMQAELKALKAERKTMLRLKVSAKGAVCVYGLNSRFPTTLYAIQWERLIRECIETGTLQAFIDENEADLARK